MPGEVLRQPDREGTSDENLDAPLLAARPDERGVDDRDIRLLQTLTAAGIALVVVAGTVAFFAVRVCEQQLSAKGVAVRVCRHLQVSDPPAIGVGIVLLAMLSVFFTKVSILGLTLERELERFKSDVGDDLRLHAEQIRLADARAAEVGEVAAKLSEGKSRAGRSEREAVPASPPDPIQALADEYNRIRLTMPSGQPRTNAMTRVVTKLISALKDVKDFDVPAHLESEDRGLRLAGYAYLHAYPDPRWTAALAESVIDREDKPFGQYWGLRALRNQCATDPLALDMNTRRRLQNELRPKLPTGSDRANELAAILAACRAK